MQVHAASELEVSDVEKLVSDVRRLIQSTPVQERGGLRYTFHFGPWGIECHRHTTSQKPKLLGAGTTRFRVVLKGDGDDISLWNVREDEKVCELHSRKPAALLHEILEAAAAQKIQAAAEAPAHMDIQELFAGFVKKLHNNPNVYIDVLGAPDHPHLHEVFFMKLGVTVKFYPSRNHPFIYVTNTQKQYRRLEEHVTVDKLLQAIKDLAVAHVTGAAETDIDEFASYVSNILPGIAHCRTVHVHGMTVNVYRRHGSELQLFVWFVSLGSNAPTFSLSKNKAGLISVYKESAAGSPEIAVVKNTSSFFEDAMRAAIPFSKVEAAAEKPINHYSQLYRSITPGRHGKLRFSGFGADFIVFRAGGTNGLLILRDDTIDGVFEDVWYVLQPKGQALALTKVEREHSTNKQTRTEVGLVRNDAKFLTRAFKLIVYRGTEGFAVEAAAEPSPFPDLEKKRDVLEKLRMVPDKLTPVPGRPGVYDYHGDVNWTLLNLRKFPIRLRNVYGNFLCGNNKLTSLQGAPEKVGSFSCSHNPLRTLKGCPAHIPGDFDAICCGLTSLEGAPERVDGDFSVSSNKLSSLRGGPTTVGRVYSAYKNVLTSLEGAPEKVGSSFVVADNQLSNLRHCPKDIFWIFNFTNNNVTSLEWFPQRVGSDVFCHSNFLPKTTPRPPGIARNFILGDQRQQAQAAAEVPSEHEVDKHVRQVYEMVMRDGVDANGRHKKLLKTAKGPLTLMVFDGNPRQLELRFQGVKAHCAPMHNTLDVDIYYQGVTTNVIVPKQKSSQAMLSAVVEKMLQERRPATAAVEEPVNRLQELLDKLVLRLRTNTKTLDLKQGPYSYAIIRYTGQYFEVKLSDVLGPIGTEADPFYFGANTDNYGDNYVFFDSTRRRLNKSIKGCVQVPASVLTPEQLLSFFIRHCVEVATKHPLRGKA